jgi:hypothetical protein
MLDAFPGVAGGFKDGLVRPYPHILLCWLFQVVALGYWQTTVNSVFREALQAPRRKNAWRSVTEHRPPQRGHTPTLLVPVALEEPSLEEEVGGLIHFLEVLAEAVGGLRGLRHYRYSRWSPRFRCSV